MQPEMRNTKYTSSLITNRSKLIVLSYRCCTIFATCYCIYNLLYHNNGKYENKIKEDDSDISNSFLARKVRFEMAKEINLYKVGICDLEQRMEGISLKCYVWKWNIENMNVAKKKCYVRILQAGSFEKEEIQQTNTTETAATATLFEEGEEGEEKDMANDAESGLGSEKVSKEALLLSEFRDLYPEEISFRKKRKDYTGAFVYIIWFSYQRTKMMDKNDYETKKLLPQTTSMVVLIKIQLKCNFQREPLVGYNIL